MTDEEFHEYRKEIVRLSQQKRRLNAVKNGMCSICCVRPARKDRKTCQECTDKALKYTKAKKKVRQMER